MPRLLYVLKGGYPWGFRLQGGGEEPLYVAKVSASGKAGSAGLPAGATLRALNGAPASALSLSTANAITKASPTLTIEIDDQLSETDLNRKSPNKLSTSTTLTNSSDHHPAQNHSQHSHPRHRSRHRHHSLSRASQSALELLPGGRRASPSAGDPRGDRSPARCSTAPPTNTVLTNTSFSSTTTVSGGFQSVGTGNSTASTSCSPARGGRVTHSSSSQEVPRVSQRAASTTDLLTDSESAQEYSSSKLPAAATAPNTPLQQRKHQQSYPYSTSQGAIAFSSTPTRSQCCFLTSSCRSCFQSDNHFATFHNSDSPIHGSVDAGIKCSVTTSHEVLIPKLGREKERLVYSSDAESESGSTVNSDGSFSSTSLDFEKSETNSKSLEESDIKRLIDAIKSIETDEETPQNSDSEPILGESAFNEDSLNEDKKVNASVSLSDSDSSEDVFVHNFPVAKLESKNFENSVRKEEVFIVERSREFDSDSESSYDHSSSSGSSVDTLVFNPYILETHNKNIYETNEVSNSDPKIDGFTSINSLQYSHAELNLNSDDEDVEFSYLESECQSSDSECESIVLEELEEIFRKFGFLSNLEDFHYNEFRSIGRYSTIHEESGEDSEGSNTSLVQGTIVKTSCGMGQYYATSVTPTNETQNQIIMADQTNKRTYEAKAEEGRRDVDEHHYDDVDLEDLKTEDIIDYKSEQFSRSPRSSPNSTVNSSWRTSQASTNTIGSSSTAAGSDDTLGKDMSELSSINSRLSTINDQSDPGFSTIDRKTYRSKKTEEQETKDVLAKVPESEADVAFKMSPEITSKSNREEFSKRTPTSQKKQNSTIKDAIEDLEFIELAAKNLLEQEKSKKSSSNLLSKSSQECTFLGISPGSVAPASTPTETPASIKEQARDDFSISAEVDEQNEISDILKTNKPTLITVEIVGDSEKVDMKKSKMAPSPPPRRKHEGKSKKKKDVTFDSISEDKPPLPPSASPVPKPEVKKRWWSRSKEPPLFISRESYNEEQVVKELERLRQSYKESDLNDFLDALDKTSIPPDIDEEFFEQLLSDLREDLKISASKSTESLNVITEAPLPSTADAHESLLIDDNIQPKSRPRSSSASNKFEKVKERVKELLRRRKKGKQQKGKSSTAGVQDTSRPETPQSRPVTPQSRSATPDARGSRPHTPESTKSDDTKKNFSISGFFKKSSPKFLRKKYSEKKHRKSDATVTSESDAEDTDASKLNSRQASNQKLFESGVGSNLKERKSSLNDSQELKKEVRFCENIFNRQGECDEEEICYSIDQKPTIVEVKAKKQEVVAVEEVCEDVTDSVPKECDLGKQSTEDIVTNDAVEQSQSVEDKSVIIPLTIENLNRAENLLPKLPERAKPPRRKKKQKLIPVPIEDLTVDDFRCSFISDQSQESHLDDSSVAASEDQSGVLNKIDIAKDITEATGIFPPTDQSVSTETTENAKIPPDVISPPEKESLCYAALPSDRVDQVPETCILSSKVILAYEAPPPPSVTPSQAEVEDLSQSEVITDLPAQSIEPGKFPSNGYDEHNDDLCCKNVAKNDKTRADSINDDISSINTYSDITETNSTKEPSPAPFPDLNENAPSFYDNNNPFEEALSKITEEDTATTSNETSTPKVCTPEAVIDEDMIGVNTNDERNEPEILQSEQMTNTISTTKKLKDASEKATSGIDSCTPCTGIAVISDAMEQKVPQQEALSSPSHESHSEPKPLSSEIDALTSLAEEMAHLTCELEEESEANEYLVGETGHSFTKINSPTNMDTLRDFSQSFSPTSFTKHIHDSSTPDLLSRVQVNNVQQSFEMSNTELFDPLTKKSVESLNLEKQTNPYDQFQHHTASSYKGSGSCNTPSQVDQIIPATSSKSFYRPSATSDYMHLSNSYNDNQTNSQPVSNWVKTAENPVPVPPRQFQQKMPMNVVAELKTLLSDNETAPILRKAPEPLPRWDSNIKFSEIAKKIPPSIDCDFTSSGFAPSASGRSIPTASDTLLSTKPELIFPAHSSETLVTDPNNAVNNVSVKSNLTSAVNDTLASSDSKVIEKYESEEMSNTNIIVNNQSVTLHDSQPTECSKAFDIGVAGKDDKETNVCLPQTTIIDKSTGPDSTFKLRATVYARFEPSDGWNYQKRKPPVPRRRLGCSLFLEDGYQSDSGISKLSKRKIHHNKCFSLFVESDRGYMSDYPSSTIGPIRGKEGAASDVSSGKLQNKGTESIPSRPPPPKSISLIPTLLFMSEGDLRIPPPVPARRSFLQLHDDQHSRRMVRNDAYIDLWSSECINRQTKIELQVAGISGRPQKKPDKPSADAANGGDTASWADKACVSKSGTYDVNCVGGVDVGGDYGGVAVGAGGDRRVSGLVPKVSASSVSEAGQCFPPPSTHSNIAAQTQLNNTCDNLPSQSENTAIAQLCDSVLTKKVECDVVARVNESSSHSKFGGPSVKESLGSKVFNTCDRQSSGEVKLRRDVVPGGLFASKLKRASRLLDELDKMEVLSPPRYSNHLPDSYLVNTERAPTPPPRPRTPIDERDPEQVRAEKRYEGYFQGTPRAIHKPNEIETTPEPTPQQIQAAQRYSNYFLGPPRAKTPTESSIEEPDEEQIAAQKRYEGYFKNGPPRPRPVSEGYDRPPPPDREQLEAEERYQSYFQSGPPRPPRPPTPETDCKPEPDAQQKAAEKRYVSYFKGGPPRPKSQADIDFGLEEDKRQEAERRYQRYFEGPPKSRCSSLPDKDRTPSPDEQQKEAEKRYQKYFTGPPRAKHGKEQVTPKPVITQEMLEAEERLNKYFLHPVPCGEPRQLIDPPLAEEEIHRRQLLAEYWSALQERNKRRTLKVVKVSKAKNEIEREVTPPTQRDLVVEEFLQKVKHRKKERDLHYGDTDSEDEGEDYKRKSKSFVEEVVVPPDLKLEGGGTLAERVASDLGNFIGEEALQQLGLNESSLLGEIENILGIGSLSKHSTAPQSRISPPKGFSLSEYSKPATTSFSYPKKDPPNSQKFANAKSDDSAASEKPKWMRTATGGYVKAPSQESLIDSTRGSKESLAQSKSSPTPRPQSPKASALYNTQTSHVVTISSESKIHSLEQTPKSTTFVRKSTEFNQPNQFITQYSQAQLSSSPQRSTSLTRTDPSNVQSGIGSFQRSAGPSLSPARAHAGGACQPPSGSTESMSGPPQPTTRLFYNKSPVAFSSIDKAGSASPSLGRKEYRKVAYDGSTLRRRPSQENVSAPRPEESFAWRNQEAEKLRAGLPRSQNPTVTLLQKKREGQIPSRRPEYLQDESSLYKPSDKLYTIKREYESEDEDGSGSRRFAVLGPRKVEGVGPTTVDGVPVSLKTGIKSEHQGEWYRKMFDSLHKVKDDDFVTVKYKVPRVRYGSSGYMSEPEGYESDYGLSSRYSTLDRRGGRGGGYDWDPNDTLSRNVKRYVHQPGRIEDYIPGFSSLSEKELRANPEVEFKIEAKGQDPPRGSSNHRYNPQRMQMSHALKETGYESDSTLVFRKQSERRPENRDVSELYRQIQRGGEVPLEGLRKAAPRKPKDSPFKYETSEVNIHYKTPVRLEQKDHIPDEELARRQEEHMRRVYEQERRKKYLAELEDIERRRHTDNFTPLQKSSPIPLNRYDDDPLGSRGSKQVARALFNFNAQNKRELSFSKGDIISVRRQIDKNWHEGELKGLVGIFPSNYVEILPAESFKSSSRKPSEGQARARFAFQAQTAMEMSFSKGETVVLTRRVDENWYEGRVGQQRRGIFPVSYVDVLVEPGDKGVSPSCSPLPRPALPASNVLYNGVPSTNSAYSTLSGGAATQATSIETRATYSQQLSVNTQQDTVPYRALYNYKPQNEDELELSEGDIVMVMEKCDDGWYVGTSRRTSLFGTFPGNYVERVA